MEYRRKISFYELFFLAGLTLSIDHILATFSLKKISISSLSLEER